MPKQTAPMIEIPDDIATLLTTVAQQDKLQVPKGLLAELRRYCTVGAMLPGTITSSAASTLAAQEALVALEARLDRCMAVHFDARFILQRIAAAESRLLRHLEQQGVLSERLSNHQVDRKLRALAPPFYTLKARWELVAELCRDLQRRLDQARDTIRIMMKLDDNARWAQNRVPGG